MITRNGKNRRIQAHQRLDATVQCFNMIYLGKEVSVFAATVRIFIVDEEIVVFFPVYFKSFQLIRKGLAAI